MNFQPDYRHIVNAAYNREAVRLPLYEHIVSADVIGKITGKDFSFDEKLVSVVNVIRIDVKEFTAKERKLPAAIRGEE